MPTPVSMLMHVTTHVQIAFQRQLRHTHLFFSAAHPLPKTHVQALLPSLPHASQNFLQLRCDAEAVRRRACSRAKEATLSLPSDRRLGANGGRHHCARCQPRRPFSGPPPPCTPHPHGGLEHVRLGSRTSHAPSHPCPPPHRSLCDSSPVSCVTFGKKVNMRFFLACAAAVAGAFYGAAQRLLRIAKPI